MYSEEEIRNCIEAVSNNPVNVVVSRLEAIGMMMYNDREAAQVDDDLPNAHMGYSDHSNHDYIEWACPKCGEKHQIVDSLTGTLPEQINRQSVGQGRMRVSCERTDEHYLVNLPNDVY
jgi:hypothetical protein